MILLRNVMLGVTVVGAVCGVFCEAISPVVSVAQQASQAVAPAQPKAGAAQADRAYPASMETALGERIAALLAEPAVSHAHWGIAVTAMDGTPLYGSGEGEFFRPASVAKLYTTAAAMALLGPDQRFTTTVIAQGSTNHGVLRGDLVLRGGGDANFDSETPLPYREPGSTETPAAPRPPLADIDEMAAELAHMGFKEIDGDVVGDDRLFDAPYPEGWSTEDLLWGYGAPVSALTVHDNLIDVTLTPAKKVPGPIEVSLRPDLRYYNIVPGGSYGVSALEENWTFLERDPGSLDLVIDGVLPPGHAAVHEQIAIADPAQYAAMALRAALERQGVIVKGTARAQHELRATDIQPFRTITHAPLSTSDVMELSAGARRACIVDYASGYVPPIELTKHVSAPLLQDLTMTLKTSDNLHAEIMLRNIGSVLQCGLDGSLAKSVQFVRQYWIHAGLSGDDFEFFDGSGLSTKDLVTPRATVQLLAYAARQRWFPQWKAALPVGGVDGTLSARFRPGEGVPAEVAALQGKVFAKTGTLGESRALAGYVEAASGKTVIFAVMVDNHAPGSSADRVAMDKIVAAIAAAY